VKQAVSRQLSAFSKDHGATTAMEGRMGTAKEQSGAVVPQKIFAVKKQ
jgi:hypothetical protein